MITLLALLMLKDMVLTVLVQLDARNVGCLPNLKSGR